MDLGADSCLGFLPALSLAYALFRWTVYCFSGTFREWLRFSIYSTNMGQIGSISSDWDGDCLRCYYMVKSVSLRSFPLSISANALRSFYIFTGDYYSTRDKLDEHRDFKSWSISNNKSCIKIIIFYTYESCLSTAAWNSSPLVYYLGNRINILQHDLWSKPIF